MKSKKRNIVIKIIIILLLLVISFLAIFFYYCPADYVKTEDGEVYLVNGEPQIYHRDMFGNTFVFDNGVRVYVAIPEYAGSPNE